MGKAVIYVRVSEARQIENTSLAGQEAVCREWCRKNSLHVDRVFVERGESAKSANRPEFQAMFNFLALAAKGSISHVVVYKFDRFSRNVEDGAAYRMELRKLGIALRSATEQTDDSPAGRLLTTVLGGIAQFDNDTRAQRTLDGMKNRLESGRWQWAAPTGYLTGSKSGPSLVPDPERGPLIAKLFELVATGEHTKASALAAVTALGLRSRRGAPLTQETVRKILVNKLYYGEMSIEKWGTSVQADCTPLVSRTTFDRVQMVLAGRAPVSVPHIREHMDFPLRGLILCPECGKPVTASKSKGKAGGRFRYYRCHRVNGHMNVRAEVIEGAFVDLLNRLTPKPERMALIERIIRTSWTERIRIATSESTALEHELAKAKRRKQRILDQLADGVLSPEDFRGLIKTANAEIDDLNERLTASEPFDLDVDTAIEYLTHLLWNTSIVWQTSDFSGKSSIQRRLFPNGLTWQKTSFGTPVTHSIYCLLVDDSADESRLVSPMGFEPMLSP